MGSFFSFLKMQPEPCQMDQKSTTSTEYDTAPSSPSNIDSQYCPRWKYDVFLSFRGEDTRRTFTGHLYGGLRNRGIFTFQDDKRLEHGDSILEELLKAIEESQAALVVFSKNYATSSWCLNELVKIMERKVKNRQTVIPVFYDVDPSHVRNQTTGSFAKAFAKYELKYKGDAKGMQKVQGWRNALTAAANLKGYDIRDGIEMHDLIQDMGRYVVKMQKDSGELSRLWDAEDFEEVMVNNMGTMAVEAIWCTYIRKLCFSKEAMKNMKRLRILYVRETDDETRWFRYFPPLSSASDLEDVPYDSNCRDGSIEYLPNNLRWFVWHDYPWMSLPENFKPQRLVHLDLRWSSLHDLWTKRKEHLPSLRKLDLKYSESLMRTPDFTGMPNLEYLNLEECMSLEEVHHSLGYCEKLIELNLNLCTRLESFPCVNMESLKSLELSFCYSLKKFPEILGRVKPELVIKMNFSGIKELPSSIIQHQARLPELDFSSMEN